MEIGCRGETIAVHARSYATADFISNPLHYLALLEHKSRALDQAAPLDDCQLDDCIHRLRRLMEARMGNAGRREFIQVLRLMENFHQHQVEHAVTEALRLGAISFDAVKMLLLARLENRSARSAREGWAERQPAFDINSLVFIDESGFTINMVRRRGHFPIGQRLLAKTPHGHWRTTTFLAALRHDGLTAPLTLDGPMDGETFSAWTQQFLSPVLKPGDKVIMDNLPVNKVAGIREAIEAQGARLLYLPPYSPDLNPIEQVFAKFKAALRKAMARPVAKLWSEIANTLRSFSPQECTAYLKRCGYCN